MKNFQLVFILVCCLHTFLLGSIQAQIIDKGELKKGSLLLEQIKSGEIHQYFIKLKKDEFSFIKLKQFGTDVIISTFDKEKNKIKDFNTLNGNTGPEFVSITSQDKGVYFLEIKPLNSQELAGKYELSVEKVVAKAISNSQKMDELFAQYDNANKPGMSVVVLKNEEVIFNKGYGSANLEYDIPITSKTIFNIASVSKQFTAFSIFLLANEKNLSLNDDVRKYIPELPDFGKTITLQQLANHTSGLRGHLGLLGLTGWRYEDILTNEQLLKLVCEQNQLNYNPGEKFLYLNTGYFLLAIVVERVSGMTFSEYCKQNIFKPLNMNNSRVLDNIHLVIENMADSYSSEGNSFKKELLADDIIGPSNILTNIEDMSLWAANFIAPKVGNVDIIEQMNSCAELNNGKKINWYANGQDVRTYRGLKLYSHGGITGGFRTFFGRFPDQKLSIILMSNDGSIDWDGLGLQIADIYLQGSFTDTKPENNKKNIAETGDMVASSEILKEYCGQYELAPGMMIDISMEGSTLFGTAPGQSKLALSPITETEFSIQGVDGKVKFINDTKGGIEKLILSLNGNNSPAKKIKFDASSLNFAQYAGDYYSVELGTIYSFRIKENKLFAEHIRADNVELTPTGNDLFSGNQWYFNEVEFVRDTENKVIGFKVSSGRCKNIMFDKLNHDK